MIDMKTREQLLQELVDYQKGVIDKLERHIVHQESLRDRLKKLVNIQSQQIEKLEEMVGL